MTLLAGIMGARNTAFAAANAPTEFTDAEGDFALGRMRTADIAMDVAASRLDRLMGAAEAIEVINPQSADARVMARMHLASAMSDCEIADNDAAELTSGLESDSVVAGLEAWSSIKDFVKSIIEFIQKQWRKFKRFVAKYWNKYFGDVERLQKSWVKIQEDAKKKQTGYTLEKNGKGDFEKTADYFYGANNNAAAKLTGDDLVDAADGYLTLATLIREKVLDIDFKDLKEDDLLNSDGVLLSDSTIYGKIGPNGKQLGDDTFKEIKAASFGADATRPVSTKYCVAASSVLAGRVRLYVTAGTASSFDKKQTLDASVRASSMLVDTVEKDQKKMKKATVAYVTADVVESIADKNIELLTEIHGIQRSKRLEKVSDELDKASKALDVWSKNVPDDKDAPEKRSNFRLAVKIATEAFSMQRRIKVNAPIAFCQAARLASSAHHDYCSRCLGAMKKD